MSYRFGRGRSRSAAQRDQTRTVPEGYPPVAGGYGPAGYGPDPGAYGPGGYGPAGQPGQGQVSGPPGYGGGGYDRTQGYGPVSGPPGYGQVSGPPGYGQVSGPPGYGPGGYGPPPPGYGPPGHGPTSDPPGYGAGGYGQGGPDGYGPGPGGYGPPPPPPGYGPAPAAVRIVAWLYYIAGLVLIFGGFAAGVVGVGADDLAASLPFEVREAVQGYGIAIAALMVFSGFLAIGLGRRLRRGKRWARMFVLVLSVLSLAGTVVSVARTGQGEPLSGVVLPVLNLILLNVPAARAWYRRY
ncbi:hypothetical protein Val02_89050 [Virgisporangium aliadipatigenens]|uniref:Uncharacterized protein n=1 Tax=Virgisporangium aliadipatigenens TaxID=741659 RepID=A0A8J3YUP0_9ACTN|nr:hypothetical protein [Virgisporangium aliadipatigenens]GIJ52019.1 hypothetical protein Val02_89050 [Virgisporangium aliadipatigenens]